MFGFLECFVGLVGPAFLASFIQVASVSVVSLVRAVTFEEKKAVVFKLCFERRLRFRSFGSTVKPYEGGTKKICMLTTN